MKKQEKQDLELRLVEIVTMLIIIAGFFLVVKPSITGHATLDITNETFNDRVNVDFDSNTSYEWIPSHEGLIKSIGLSGYFEGDSALIKLGDKIVYSYGYEKRDIESEVISELSDNINLIFGYGNNPDYDLNNDGTTYKKGIIDFSVNAKFDFEQDYSKLCTKYFVTDLDENITDVECYGNIDCCMFLGLDTESSSWNDSFYLNYGKDGAGYDNEVSAQVIYYDVDLSEENLHSDIYNSEIRKLGAKFTDTVYFDNICIDSCDMDLNNNESYTLEIASNGLLHLSNISYDLGGILTKASDFNKTESIRQYSAVIGKPVKWKKTVKVDVSENRYIDNLSIDLPDLAGNVSVTKIDGDNRKIEDVNVNIKNEKTVEEIEPIVAITGNTVSGFGFISSVRNDIKKSYNGFSTITGLAISDSEENVTVNVEEEIKNNDEVVVEYYTDAPYALEDEVSSKEKEVIVVGPDSVHYTDVLAYSDLPSQVSDVSSIKLYWIVNGTKTTASFDAYDSDSDGLYDYIEWVVPHLSNQTYEIIIEITKASLLDSNRTFVSDIYDYVKAQDGNWSEIINSGEYVRVTFERNLTNKNDVTVYARSACNVSIRINDVDVPCEIYQKKIRLDELRNMVGESR
jgi:hypothetical protein